MTSLARGTLILLIASACAPAEPADTPVPAAASSARFGRDSSDNVTAIIVNRRWLAERLDNEGTRWVVIAESDSARWCGGELEWCHSVGLRGWLGAPDTMRATDWTAAVDGNPGGFEPRYRPEFYRVQHPGCCDSQNAASYISIETGEVAFRSTSELLRVTSDWELIVRRVGYLDTWSALKPSEAASLPGLGGLLQYGDPAGIAKRIALVADTTIARYKHCCRLDSIELRASPRGKGSTELLMSGIRDLPSWKAEARFTIWIRLLPSYDEGLVELHVPVLGDSISIEHASLPKGLRLVRIPDAT